MTPGSLFCLCPSKNTRPGWEAPSSPASAHFCTCGWGGSSLRRWDPVLFARGDRTEIAFSFVPFYASRRHKLAIKNKQPAMWSDLLLEKFTMWISLSIVPEACVVVQNLSHWGKSICFWNIQCLNSWASTVFQFYVYVCSYVSPHASYVMCVDMWTLEGLDKAQNGSACFHPQQQSETSCRCLIWQLKELVHPNYRKITYISIFCLDLSLADFEFICTYSESSVCEIFFHHSHCCHWTMSSERQ